MATPCAAGGHKGCWDYADLRDFHTLLNLAARHIRLSETSNISRYLPITFRVGQEALTAYVLQIHELPPAPEGQTWKAWLYEEDKEGYLIRGEGCKHNHKTDAQAAACAKKAARKDGGHWMSAQAWDHRRRLPSRKQK